MVRLTFEVIEFEPGMASVSGLSGAQWNGLTDLALHIHLPPVLDIRGSLVAGPHQR